MPPARDDGIIPVAGRLGDQAIGFWSSEMKNFSLFVGLLFLGWIAGVTRADDPAISPGMLDPVKLVQTARKAVDTLTLSDEQKPKVTAILDAMDVRAKTLA